MQYFPFILRISCFLLFLTACSEQPKPVPADSLPQQVSASDSPPANPPAPLQVEARTFENTDGTGGWGYDLYVNGKRTIHQPIIPALSGNTGFHTEAEAKKTGDYAAQKYMRTGQFPSLTIQELDSLGIK